MGLAIPPPPVIGNPCAVCDGVLWPAGATPQFIHVHFWEIIKCPLVVQDPPDGIYVLQQDLIDPCIWEYFDGDYGIEVNIDVAQWIRAIGFQGPGVEDFFFAPFVPCQSLYDNAYVACLLNFGKGGTCEITWS